jgi:hypothetical protein
MASPSALTRVEPHIKEEQCCQPQDPGALLALEARNAEITAASTPPAVCYTVVGCALAAGEAGRALPWLRRAFKDDPALRGQDLFHVLADLARRCFNLRLDEVIDDDSKLRTLVATLSQVTCGIR